MISCTTRQIYSDPKKNHEIDCLEHSYPCCITFGLNCFDHNGQAS